MLKPTKKNLALIALAATLLICLIAGIIVRKKNASLLQEYISSDISGALLETQSALISDTKVAFVEMYFYVNLLIGLSLNFELAKTTSQQRQQIQNSFDTAFESSYDEDLQDLLLICSSSLTRKPISDGRKVIFKYLDNLDKHVGTIVFF